MRDQFASLGHVLTLLALRLAMADPDLRADAAAAARQWARRRYEPRPRVARGGIPARSATKGSMQWPCR
jgi:hypothetical protein